MNKEINLLSGKRSKIIHEYQTARTANVIAIIFLFIVVILSFLSFYLNQTLQTTEIEQQKKNISTQITLSQQKIITLLLIKARLNEIYRIDAAQNPNGSILSDINTVLPPNVNIESCTINQKKLSIIVSSQSLSSLQVVLDSITNNLKNKQFFQRITINSLTTDPVSLKYILFVEADII